MRSLALFFVAAVAFSSAEFYGVERLIEEAGSLGASFTEKSLGKLHSGNWQPMRGNNTMNVVLFNTASKRFHLKKTGCSSGSPSSGLLPEVLLPSSQSIAFGFDGSSHGDQLNCKTFYQTADGGSWINMMISDNDSGAVYISSSSDLSALPVLGSSRSGMHSQEQVRVVIKDLNQAPRQRSSRHGGGFSHLVRARTIAAMG